MYKREAGYILAITAGNTNITFGIYAGSRYLGKWRMEMRPNRSADEYGLWLYSVLEQMEIAPHHVIGAVISCVVPIKEEVLLTLCRRYFEVDPVLIGPGIRTGIKINHGRAGDLAPNRVANLVALAEEYESPSIVVDFGTVISIDVLGQEKDYLGGVVTPGLMTSLGVIPRVAPHLPTVGLSVVPENIIGRNIQHSIQAGCYWGTIDMVQGLIYRIWEEIGIEKSNVVATGGLAKSVALGTPIFNTIDTNLTLNGLRLIYERNTDNVVPRAKHPLGIDIDNIARITQ